jgi:hypothetical protein
MGQAELTSSLHRDLDHCRHYGAYSTGSRGMDAPIISLCAQTILTRSLSPSSCHAGQPHFPAAAIDKCMAGQVELAVLDFYRHWDSFVAFAPCRRRWLAEPLEQLLFVQSVVKRYICSLKRMARSDNLVGSVPHQDRCWNLVA